MVSYEQAGKMLDKAVDALPQEIFRELNGGVNLLRDAKRDEDGTYVMGLYHTNVMGRYVELFYGSFCKLYGDIPAEQFERRLVRTLHHELTHHIEALAGDRSLEKWDYDQEVLREYMENAPSLPTNSVLFVDDDDTSLAPCAKAFFGRFADEKCHDVIFESAGLDGAGERMNPDCAKTAAAMGADISCYEMKILTEEMLVQFDAVMCMTLAQADEICDRFPGNEEKVMCIAESDILRPKMRLGWKNALRRLYDECTAIAEELNGEAEE